MTFFRTFEHRATESEQMDLQDSDESLLFNTLDQFHQINLLFSRVRGLLRRTILQDMQPGRSYHLLDLGAGACDIPVWLLQEAAKQGKSLRITAVDADPRVIDYAQTRYGEIEHLTVLQADALDLKAFAPFDYVFANHFLHHLSSEEAQTLLRDAGQIAERGFVFSDLRRSPWSYLGFSLFARMYRNSFSREDGLLSIRKGFRKEDLKVDPDVRVRYALPGRIQWISLP